MLRSNVMFRDQRLQSLAPSLIRRGSQLLPVASTSVRWPARPARTPAIVASSRAEPPHTQAGDRRRGTTCAQWRLRAGDDARHRQCRRDSALSDSPRARGAYVRGGGGEAKAMDLAMPARLDAPAASRACWQRQAVICSLSAPGLMMGKESELRACEGTMAGGVSYGRRPFHTPSRLKPDTFYLRRDPTSWVVILRVGVDSMSVCMDSLKRRASVFSTPREPSLRPGRTDPFRKTFPQAGFAR